MARTRNKQKIATKLLGAWVSEDVNERFENILSTKPHMSKSALLAEIITNWLQNNEQA